MKRLRGLAVGTFLACTIVASALSATASCGAFSEAESSPSQDPDARAGDDGAGPLSDAATGTPDVDAAPMRSPCSSGGHDYCWDFSGPTPETDFDAERTTGAGFASLDRTVFSSAPSAFRGELLADESKTEARVFQSLPMSGDGDYRLGLAVRFICPDATGPRFLELVCKTATTEGAIFTLASADGGNQILAQAFGNHTDAGTFGGISGLPIPSAPNRWAHLEIRVRVVTTPNNGTVTGGFEISADGTTAMSGGGAAPTCVNGTGLELRLGPYRDRASSSSCVFWLDDVTLRLP